MKYRGDARNCSSMVMVGRGAAGRAVRVVGCRPWGCDSSDVVRVGSSNTFLSHPGVFARGQWLAMGGRVCVL